jgi:hypothetical protein
LDNLSQLKQLTFGWAFNQPDTNLFNNLSQLEQLTFGYNFNQNLDIPTNIKIIILDCNNKYIIENLPNNIEELYLDWNFNLELNDLPSSIKIIKFYKNCIYNKKLNNLPKSLEQIHIPKSFENKIQNLNQNCTIIFI